MTFALPYKIAVFAGQTCQLFASVDSLAIASAMQQDSMEATDQRETQLAALASFDFSQLSAAKRILVLVPDDWVKVTQPIIEHPVSAQLLPLAALSYAVEVTFATPQETHYAFLQERIHAKQTRLTIFACAQNWLEDLLAPFEEQGASCILMPFSLYQKLNSKSWSACYVQRLTSFQPNFQRQQRVRQYLLVGLVVSLFLHCVAGFYYYYLHDAINNARIGHAQILDVQSNWLQDQQTQAFPLSVLNLMQELPKEVRVEQFYAYQQQANMQLVLPKNILEQLLETWQERYPSWRWSLVQSAVIQAPSQELVNAYIQIVTDEK